MNNNMNISNNNPIIKIEEVFEDQAEAQEIQPVTDQKSQKIKPLSNDSHALEIAIEIEEIELVNVNNLGKSNKSEVGDLSDHVIVIEEITDKRNESSQSRNSRVSSLMSHMSVKEEDDDENPLDNPPENENDDENINLEPAQPNPASQQQPVPPPQQQPNQQQPQANQPQPNQQQLQANPAAGPVIPVPPPNPKSVAPSGANPAVQSGQLAAQRRAVTATAAVAAAAKARPVTDSMQAILKTMVEGLKAAGGTDIVIEYNLKDASGKYNLSDYKNAAGVALKTTEAVFTVRDKNNPALTAKLSRAIYTNATDQEKAIACLINFAESVSDAALLEKGGDEMYHSPLYDSPLTEDQYQKLMSSKTLTIKFLVDSSYKIITAGEVSGDNVTFKYKKESAPGDLRSREVYTGRGDRKIKHYKDSVDLIKASMPGPQFRAGENFVTFVKSLRQDFDDKKAEFEELQKELTDSMIKKALDNPKGQEILAARLDRMQALLAGMDKIKQALAKVPDDTPRETLQQKNNLFGSLFSNDTMRAIYEKLAVTETNETQITKEVAKLERQITSANTRLTAISQNITNIEASKLAKVEGQPFTLPEWVNRLSAEDTVYLNQASNKDLALAQLREKTIKNDRKLSTEERNNFMQLNVNFQDAALNMSPGSRKEFLSEDNKALKQWFKPASNNAIPNPVPPIQTPPPIQAQPAPPPPPPNQLVSLQVVTNRLANTNDTQAQQKAFLFQNAQDIFQRQKLVSKVQRHNLDAAAAATFKATKTDKPAYFTETFTPSNQPPNVTTNAGFYSYDQTQGREDFWVDFSNASLGGGCFTHGFVQEEIMVAEMPDFAELLAQNQDSNRGGWSSISTRQGDMNTRTGVLGGSPTPVLMKGLTRVQKVKVYGDSISNKPTLLNTNGIDLVEELAVPQKVNLLAIAAPKLNSRTSDEQYHVDTLSDIFNTIVAGLTLVKQNNPTNNAVVHSGQLGCGAFMNDPRAVYLLHRLAAEYKGVDLVLHDYKPQASLDYENQWNTIRQQLVGLPQKTIQECLEVISQHLKNTI